MLGIGDDAQIFRAVDAVIAGSAPDALRVVQDVASHGRDLGSYAREIERHARDLLVCCILGGVPPEVRLTADRDQLLDDQARRIGRDQATRLLELLAEAMTAARDGADQRAMLELALVKAADPTVDPALRALQARLARLEEQLAGGGAPPAPSAPAPAPAAAAPEAVAPAHESAPPAAPSPGPAPAPGGSHPPAPEAPAPQPTRAPEFAPPQLREVPRPEAPAGPVVTDHNTPDLHAVPAPAPVPAPPAPVPPVAPAPAPAAAAPAPAAPTPPAAVPAPAAPSPPLPLLPCPSPPLRRSRARPLHRPVAPGSTR